MYVLFKYFCENKDLTLSKIASISLHVSLASMATIRCPAKNCWVELKTVRNVLVVLLFVTTDFPLV